MNTSKLKPEIFNCLNKEEIVKRSTKSKRYVSIMGLMLAVSLALFMFSGCSSKAIENEQNPIDPKVNYLYETGEADQNYAGPALFDVTEMQVSKVIGILGGTINVPIRGADATFTIPAGAVLLPIEISLKVTRYGTPFGPLFIYDCGPDGTKFKVSAELSQPLPEGQNYAFIYYFNEATRNWEFQEVVKVKDGVATFKIKHFSKYGIS